MDLCPKWRISRFVIAVAVAQLHLSHQQRLLLRFLQVHKLLGKGSYGKVYKVQRASDDKFYALKETDLGALNQMERMDAVNEVRLLVSMSHPSVVGGSPFIVSSAVPYY